jgi:hypothetical protein
MGDIISATADIFGFGPASRAADATTEAAGTSAAAQLQAAQIAADAARFRPVGMTNRFGTAAFGTDAAGNVNAAGYVLSPELKALQDYVMQQTTAGQGDTGRLLSLGRGYLSQTPEAAAQQYMSQQQGLLAPGREQQLASLRNAQFQTGRTGLATGGTMAGGMQQTSPELAAYYNALAQQDAQLAAGARQAGQQDITFGQGLLSSAYSPLQTGLGVASSLEALGQTPLALGAELGGRSAQAGQTQAQALLSGGLRAAGTLQAAAPLGAYAQAQGMAGLLNNPALSAQNLSQSTYGKQASNWFNNLISPTPYSDRGTMYSNTPGSYTEFDY